MQTPSLSCTGKGRDKMLNLHGPGQHRQHSSSSGSQAREKGISRTTVPGIKHKAGRSQNGFPDLRATSLPPSFWSHCYYGQSGSSWQSTREEAALSPGKLRTEYRKAVENYPLGQVQGQGYCSAYFSKPFPTLEAPFCPVERVEGNQHHSPNTAHLRASL